MKELIQSRRRAFLTACLKYLRYVLNDHFILVLLVFLGFVLFQYRTLLNTISNNSWPVLFLLASCSIFLVWWGNTATYLEEPDKVFCLPKEREVITLVESAYRTSFLIWLGVLVGVQLFLMPLYMRLGLPILGMVVYVFVLGGLKHIWWQKKQAAVLSDRGLAWNKVVVMEQERKQRILRFFALFTTVKGISSSVTRRTYLDFFLRLVPKSHQQTWTYLYARSFLRSGDLMGLSLRLLILSIVCLFAISESWLAVGFVLLFDFLLLFQLMGLYKVYDYQYMTILYPLTTKEKKAGFQLVVRSIFYLIVSIQLFFSVWWISDKVYLLVLAGSALLLSQVYLSLKMSKMD